jgi:hypothetical protein
MTAEWLSNGGGPKYPVDKLYVWTAGGFRGQAFFVPGASAACRQAQLENNFVASSRSQQPKPHQNRRPPGSWDALGVHYRSADSSGSWADNEIIEMVKNHNSKV